MPHQVWTLLVLAVLWTLALARTGPSPQSQAENAPRPSTS
jgi:hypothetical protein